MAQHVGGDGWVVQERDKAGESEEEEQELHGYAYERPADSLLLQQQPSAGVVRQQQLRRRWFNGRMYSSHAYDPGSTPGRRKPFFSLLSPFHRFLETDVSSFSSLFLCNSGQKGCCLRLTVSFCG